MSLLRSRVEKRALPSSIDPNQVTARPLFGNYSGELVTETNMFTSSAVIGCVTLLGDSIATMPVKTFRNIDNRYEQLPPPSWLQHPNADQTMFEFIHQTIITAAIHGNAFIFVARDGNEILELRNIHPDKVQPLRLNGEIFYRVGETILDSSEVKHLRWLQLANSLLSLSPLDALRNTIGTNLAIERFLSQFYGDGATPSSVLETDQQLTTQQADVLRETWVDSLYKRRRPAVLTGGLKWRSITASATDMDTMAHREAIVRDIARAYRIPLYMILGTGGDTQTYQNIEAAGMNFVRHTLLPWMRRLEDALSDLMPPGQFIRLDPDEFLRADMLTRVRTQQLMIMSGTMTPNEARYDLGREPYEGGDQFILGVPGAPMASVEGSETLPTLGKDGEPPQ
jgi:HK97 family phage portal protein